MNYMRRRSIRLFEWLLPKLWRSRLQPDGGRNDAVLARVTDTDPVYRAVMDHAYAQLEESTSASLQPKLSASEREFLAGRANGLLTLISTLENTRERARKLMLEEQRKRAQAA